MHSEDQSYQEKNTLLDETMFNLLDAVSYAGCEDESDGLFSAIVQGGSCVMSAATRLARVGQYINCIDYKTQEFHNTYLDWKNEPEKQKSACEKDLKVVQDTPKIVASYHEEIFNLNNEIKLKQEQKTHLKNKLNSMRELRKKQSTLLDTLQK